MVFRQLAQVVKLLLHGFAFWSTLLLAKAEYSNSNLSKLFVGSLVMYDRTTYSLWTQAGVAFAGPATGMRLRRIPSVRTPWWVWRDRHPETLVMKPVPRPGRRPDRDR